METDNLPAYVSYEVHLRILKLLSLILILFEPSENDMMLVFLLLLVVLAIVEQKFHLPSYFPLVLLVYLIALNYFLQYYT